MSAANVWSEIDALKAKHQAEHAATVAALEEIPGAGELRIDDYGVWKVRCRRGREPSELVTARGGVALLDRVRAYLEKPKEAAT